MATVTKGAGMALTFKKIEAFNFGGLKVEPQMTQELDLRVRNLKITTDNLNEARKTLASCFGTNANEVEEFMAKNLFLLDLVKIQVYLTQGDSGLQAYEARMEKFLNKEVEKAMNNSVAEVVND
ncbi:MAG: hypothetical protein NC548_27245 [Lachnospiraceae bacterium]|nr:hypothetical protein [Lachnospiraceae bacterium]